MSYMDRPTREDVIAEVESWKGTQWMHGVALKGYRTDCVQYLIQIAKHFGWIPESYVPPKYRQDYALHNDDSILKVLISEVCYEIDSESKDIGDILLFVSGKCASHAGIYIGRNRMVHAHILSGVREDGIDKRILDSVWRFKSLVLRES